MTLFRQLALLLTLFLILVLATVMTLHFRATLINSQHQLYVDAQNTASSLSLSLATAKGDESVMSTMINANFDSGHYSLISLQNMQNEVVYERLEDTCAGEIPAWFVALVSFKAPTALAQVSSGWMVIGQLSVESDTAPTYEMLYDLFLQMLLSFALFLMVSVGALYMLLYTILRPLHTLQLQAEAIGRNEFKYQEKLPYTTEFRKIVLSMNSLVKKIEMNFLANTKVIQKNRQLLYTERLPKLYNQHYLMLKFNEEVLESGEYNGGAILTMVLRDGSNGLVQSEAMLRLAAVMISKSEYDTNNVVAQIEQKYLLLLLPGMNALEACQVRHKIALQYAEQSQENNLSIESGLYLFSSQEKSETFVENALKSLHSSDDVCTLSGDDLELKERVNQDDWSQLITSALKDELFNYEVRNVIDVSSNLIYDRGLSIVLRDKAGNSYGYGQFIAQAVKAHKVLEIYMQVIKKLVENFSAGDKKGRYTFSFAGTLLREEKTFALLQHEFENFQNTHDVDFCIELPESFVVSQPEMALRYVALIKEHGYRFGIGEFSAASDNLEYLKQFRPEFIKISKLFLLDLIEQSSPLLSSLQMATDALEITIIATGVSTHEELALIEGAGIKIVQGYITEIV